MLAKTNEEPSFLSSPGCNKALHPPCWEVSRGLWSKPGLLFSLSHVGKLYFLPPPDSKEVLLPTSAGLVSESESSHTHTSHPQTDKAILLCGEYGGQIENFEKALPLLSARKLQEKGWWGGPELPFTHNRSTPKYQWRLCEEPGFLWPFWHNKTAHTHFWRQCGVRQCQLLNKV